MTTNAKLSTTDTCSERGVLDLVVLYENEEWQQPLFDVLDQRVLSYGKFDLKSGSFDTDEVPKAKIYFNQASPSAYIRGRPRVVPFTQALLRCLEMNGATVINGADVFNFELSKSAQAAHLKALGIDHPKTIVFNDIQALSKRKDLTFPAMLKPEQGGSGARMHKVESFNDLEELLRRQPNLWEPDKLLLLQEYLEHDPEQGIVRLELIGGELLYAMRVVTHGRYNLCPSEVCNPENGSAGSCSFLSEALTPIEKVVSTDLKRDLLSPKHVSTLKPVEFYPLHDLPDHVKLDALRIVQTANMDVAGVEYLETIDGRRVFYDINANSNLRRPIGKAFGLDPFEKVADYLERKIATHTTNTNKNISPSVQGDSSSDNEL